jgi:stringent starvation protein B
MTPSRPYLIRALYDWIVDNGLTPYLLVDTSVEGISAPLEYADGGKLVLNVAPRAVRALELGNDAVSFNARFGGSPRDVWVPVHGVLAIYSRENGQGMLFSEEDGGGGGPSGGPSGGSTDRSSGDRRPALRVVK